MERRVFPAEAAIGSGFATNPRGYVMTNNHVIKAAENIQVMLDDRSPYVAWLAGTDSGNDIALFEAQP